MIFNKFKNFFLQLWAKGAFHILIGNFLTKFATFFGSIVIVRVLTKSSYGILSYIENIYGYIYIFAGMGLGNALLRYIILDKTIEGKTGYFNYVLKKSTLINLIIVIVMSLIEVFYPHPEEFKSARWLLIMMLIALPFQYLMDNSILILRAFFDNKRYAIASFMTTVILILSKYIAAIFGDLQEVIFAVIVMTIFLGMLLYVATKKLYFNGIEPQILSKQIKRTVDRYSFQYMITNGIWSIFMLNDVFLLGVFSQNATTVADYKVAYVLTGGLAIVSSAIGIFVSPYFVRHESDYNWIRTNYKNVIGISSGLMALLVIIMYVFAKPIILLLYGTQYENIVFLMRLLLIAAFINGIRFTTANLLAAMGQIRYNMVVSSIGVVFQIGINIILIPRFGSMGLAYTSIFLYLAMALSLFIIFAKKYELFIGNK